MRSRTCLVPGDGELLSAACALAKSARSELMIVGPWIDGYVAGALVSELRRGVSLRVLTRPRSAMSEDFRTEAEQATACFLRRGAEVRLLPKLHSKLLIADRERVLLGSANWYRHSLESAIELSVVLEVAQLPGLLERADAWWARASEDPSRPVVRQSRSNGFRGEEIDPIAAAVIRRNRGVFVLRRRG